MCARVCNTSRAAAAAARQQTRGAFRAGPKDDTSGTGRFRIVCGATTRESDGFWVFIGLLRWGNRPVYVRVL